MFNVHFVLTLVNVFDGVSKTATMLVRKCEMPNIPQIGSVMFGLCPHYCELNGKVTGIRQSLRDPIQVTVLMENYSVGSTEEPQEVVEALCTCVPCWSVLCDEEF